MGFELNDGLENMTIRNNDIRNNRCARHRAWPPHTAAGCCPLRPLSQLFGLQWLEYHREPLAAAVLPTRVP